MIRARSKRSQPILLGIRLGMRFLVTRVAADFLAEDALAVLFFGVTFLAGTLSHPLHGREHLKVSHSQGLGYVMGDTGSVVMLVTVIVVTHVTKSLPYFLLGLSPSSGTSSGSGRGVQVPQ